MVGCRYSRIHTGDTRMIKVEETARGLLREDKKLMLVI